MTTIGACCDLGSRQPVRGDDAAWTMGFVTYGSLGLTSYPSPDLRSGCVAYRSLVEPGDLDCVEGAIRTAPDQRSTFDVTYAIRDRDGATCCAWEQGQGVFDGDDLIAVEGFMIDVTESAEARGLLEERVEERTRERQALLEASRMIGATLDLDELFERVSDQLHSVVPFTGAVIALREQGSYVRRASRHYFGGVPIEPAGHRYTFDMADPIEGHVLRGMPAVINDTLDDSLFAATWRRYDDPCDITTIGVTILVCCEVAIVSHRRCSHIPVRGVACLSAS